MRELFRRTGLVLALVFTLPAALFSAAASAQGTLCDGIDPEVQRMLEAMASGSENVEFTGVVTLQRGGDMQIMEISHVVSGGQETEQLARLTGQDAQVLRASHPLACIHPGHQMLKSGVGKQGGVCELATHYRFRTTPGERIAGREAVRLRAEPRDMYRFGYVFDLDRESALMLRSATLAADQRVIEQYQFASLRLGGVPSSSAAATEHRATHPHPDEVDHLRLGFPWDVAWLPAGFVTTDGAPAGSQRKSFTDGFASFSVFLEPLTRPLRDGEGIERQGSTVAYTRGMRLQQQPVLVTVLGEIPTNTARMVADSVTLR